MTTGNVDVDIVDVDGKSLIGDGEAGEQTLEFNLTLESERDVTVAAHWGIYSGTTSVSNLGTLIIP